MAATRETFADVLLRIRNALDEIYDTDEAPAIHLFLHNRCFRSLLRVIGHTQEFDMANGATVAFLVHRRQADEEDTSGTEELLAIQRDKEQLSATAQNQGEIYAVA
ncbi:hypothetical protein GE09DRAFT_1228551 [Coniochaeta sp. 2T2.1]|nr:hypothetical protein GE09DRAFT_1228551 [Coniochaeta sp. 2T2.1]